MITGIITIGVWALIIKFVIELISGSEKKIPLKKESDRWLDYWSNYIIFSVALLLSMGIAITHNCYRWLYLFSSDRIIRSEAMIS